MRSIANETLSQLISSISDCALDPEQWPQAMSEIAEVGQFCTIVMLVLQPPSPVASFVKSWGANAADLLQFEAKYADDPTVTFLHRLAEPGSDLDEPLVFRRLFDEATLARSRLYNDWTPRLGIVDSIATVALQAPGKLGIFSPARHVSVGVVTDREVRLMRLLAPHVRRAVTISDLLGMRALETQVLSDTLDALTLGIVLVDKHAQILHANAAARVMLDDGQYIASKSQRLTSQSPDLETQIATACALSPAAGAASQPVSCTLSQPGENVVTAYVLPLSSGASSTRFGPRASAAVFIKTGTAQPTSDLMIAAAAAAYRLTPAEARLLAPMSHGRTVREASLELGISENTVKSQLAQIFSKTGVSRQPELVALLARLRPPLG